MGGMGEMKSVEFPRFTPEPLTPALLLDLDALERNLERMAGHARRLGVVLRPHAKTHKCAQVARRQLELGAVGLTVATLEEAHAFADAGFDDLLWAFPLVIGRLKETRELAERVTLRLAIDSPEAFRALETEGFPFRARLKVDAGYHRAGVDPASPHALELARRLAGSKHLVFDGLLSHSGDAYYTPGREARRRAAEAERSAMAAFAETLRADGIEVPTVSVGSTPGTTAAESLEGITEIRPGNYAFFDYTQAVLGSCEVSECALTVLASVVSSQPGAEHSVVDAGALAISKDLGPEDHEPATFGRIFEDYFLEDGRAGKLSESVWLTGLSQEHGIVNAPLPVGEKVRILPNHSCLAVPHHTHYHVVRGGEIIERWPILAARHGDPSSPGE